MQIPLVDLKAQYKLIRDEVLTNTDDVFSGMQLLLGPNVRAFESEFAEYCQAEYAIGVANGTDALYLALSACGVQPGDEVITVSHSFFATVESILNIGAVPVYVDVDPDTYTLDPALLEAAVSPKTRAIVPVHLYGQMADMDPIIDVAQRHGLAVVEDACQAHGAEYKGRRAGSIGDAAAFSFYMSKNLGAYGDAGAVTTNSQAVADHIRLLRDHGSATKYEHHEVGLNSRLDEYQAMILRAKLPHLNGWNDERRAHAQTFASLLSDLNFKLPSTPDYSLPVYHLYVIQTDNRDRVQQTLGDREVATGIHYPIPIHLQPAVSEVGRISGELPVTEALADRILSLPMYPELEYQQIEYVAGCLRTISQLKGDPVGT